LTVAAKVLDSCLYMSIQGSFHNETNKYVVRWLKTCDIKAQ